MKPLFHCFLFLICATFTTSAFGVTDLVERENVNADLVCFAEVNRLRLAYQDSKQGDVVVIFDAGFGTDQKVWKDVICELPDNIRKITNSRAGLGKSSGLSQPRDNKTHPKQIAKNIVELVNYVASCVHIYSL